MMNLLSEEKSLPQKISEDIIAPILEENLQPGDKLPNETMRVWNFFCKIVFKGFFYDRINQS